MLLLIFVIIFFFFLLLASIWNCLRGNKSFKYYCIICKLKWNKRQELKGNLWRSCLLKFWICLVRKINILSVLVEIWNEPPRNVGISHRTDVQPVNLCFNSKYLNFQDCVSLLSWKVVRARGAIPNQSCGCVPARGSCTSFAVRMSFPGGIQVQSWLIKPEHTVPKLIHALISARILSDWWGAR